MSVSLGSGGSSSLGSRTELKVIETNHSWSMYLPCTRDLSERYVVYKAGREGRPCPAAAAAAAAAISGCAFPGPKINIPAS